jgi:hypothetical protein
MSASNDAVHDIMRRHLAHSQRSRQRCQVCPDARVRAFRMLSLFLRLSDDAQITTLNWHEVMARPEPERPRLVREEWRRRRGGMK